MGIEDRDYMRTPAEQAKPKGTGLAPWKVIVCVLIIAAFVVWKMGLISKFFPHGPVNVNTATMEQLVALPDIDTKIAEDIIKKRPFNSVEDLLKVKGIGEKRLAKLREKIIVADPPK